jgi:PBP1b-binding outer membrane lipoprotein LpoB
MEVNKMKRIVSLLLVCVLLVGCAFALASCGNISQGYADKINAAAKNGEAMSYDEVVEALGDEAIEIAAAKTGVVIAVAGVTSLEDLKTKIDNGETVKGIIVTMALGKATGAAYREISKDDLKI